MPDISASAETGAIVYLATVGSLLGFIAFYYVLRKLPFEIVGLVPLITPVLAMLLGVWLAGETITPELQQGSVMILAGLAVYELVPNLIARVRGLRRNRSGSVVVGAQAGAAQNQ